MTMTVTEAVQQRHSTRAFKSDPIPFEVLDECLRLAQQSPSNSNLQPWRLAVLEGAALERLEQKLLEAVLSGQASTVVPIPAPFKHYRSELGHLLYGKDGYDIPREDVARHDATERRNYTFFEAPMAMVLMMDASLAPVDVFSCGLYLQTLCLLLQERGIDNCIEVGPAGYPDVVRKVLGVEENMMVITTMAVGYEDEKHKINKIRSTRDGYDEVVTFHKD